MAGAGRPRPGPLFARAAELSWIADHEPEVASDLSAIHRIDDPMSMDCARYFQLAELLPAYEGAVRMAALVARQRAEGDGTTGDIDDVEAARHAAAATGAPGPDTVTGGTGDRADIAALAAMSQQPGGFPGIEYQA